MKKDKDNIEFVSKKTKRGILLLVFLCLLIIYIPRIISIARPSEKIELTQNEIDIIDELKTNYQAEEKAKKKRSFKRRVFRRPPSKFNPNEYTKEQWMYLGLSDKQAAVMLKISDKGIWTNDFLGRITVLPKEVFVLIKDSTYYPERVYEKRSYTNDSYNKDSDKKKNRRPFIEMNTATEEEIVSLPGIGAFFAKRILAYRELLGGYSSKEQLLEVYNLEKDRYDMFDSYFEVNPDAIDKFNINTATVDELKGHPYINFGVANSIVKMREQHGPYKSVDQIKDSELISRELFDKLKPYVYL